MLRLHFEEKNPATSELIPTFLFSARFGIEGILWRFTKYRPSIAKAQHRCKRLTTSIANNNLLEGQILMASHGTQSDMKIGIP
jgi:hypothetical protein